MEIDIFLNPNFGYLVLVAAGMLIFLAVITPGTGVLEVGALFALIFTGYAMYYLPINIWALVVLVLGFPPFIIALRSKKSWPLWLLLATVLFELGSAYFFQSDAWWLPAVNPILALVTILLSAGYLWIAVRKSLEIALKPVFQDLGMLIGKLGEAKTAIHLEGTAQVAGELWSARSDRPIPEGANIRVIERDGFTLVVQPTSEDPR
jgi:membrane-bound serine protease (ClpP class)